jgi:Sec-independent protein secretion pathway component TatC
MADITERSGLLGAPVSDEKIVYATGPPLPPPATRVFMIFVATAVTLFTAGTIFGYAGTVLPSSIDQWPLNAIFQSIKLHARVCKKHC